MAALPEIIDPTLAAVDREIEKAENDPSTRTYLGISILGTECERLLWYYFHHCLQENFTADTLKKFTDGHHGEDLQAIRLKRVKQIQLHTVDPKTGKQFGMSAVHGHVKGHMDGAILGLLQAPKTWHVWEHKQTAEKKQNRLHKLKTEKGEKQALKEWDPVYYGQAILYMHLTGMRRHYLTCSTPGGRHTISCRTEENKQHAEALLQKAERVVFTPDPLPRISERPDWYQCGYCNYRGLCHNDRVPQVNCRTCTHSTPQKEGNGTWKCEALGCELPPHLQKTGCSDHLFNPYLIPYAEMIDADPAQLPQWVKYKHRNGVEFFNITEKQEKALHQDAYYSSELHAALPEMIGDSFVREVMQADPGARITQPTDPASMVIPQTPQQAQ